MTYKPDKTIKSSEITPQEVYLNRRRFMKYGTGAALGTIASSAILAELLNAGAASAGEKIEEYAKSSFTVDEQLTAYKDFTQYTKLL